MKPPIVTEMEFGHRLDAFELAVRRGENPEVARNARDGVTGLFKYVLYRLERNEDNESKVSA